MLPSYYWHFQVALLTHEKQLSLDSTETTTKVVEIVQEYIDAKVDIATPLQSQGIDSIANMEIRQKLLVRHIGCNLSQSKVAASLLVLYHIFIIFMFQRERYDCQ